MFALWLLVGAAMVALSSFVDFHTLSNQIDAMYMMRDCNIRYESVDADAMVRALREYSRLNHPDAHASTPRILVCPVEETNAMRDSIRKHGTSRLAWLLFKLGAPPRQAENAFMVAMGALAVGAIHALKRLPLPPQLLRAATFLGLAQQGAGASTERQPMKKLKHAEFVYGTPPCTTHCGRTPSQCTVGGWAYKDVYVFWYDEADRACKHFKVSSPTETAASWTRSAFWGGAARFLYNLGDGFQPEGSMNMIGAPDDEATHDEKEEL